MKKIVTHISPDLDAITSLWLIIRYLRGFSDAEIHLVNAGYTYKDEPVDSNPDIIHVDTGLGKFDHHQTNDFTSATKLVFDFLVKKSFIPKSEEIPLKRLTNLVNDIDHFQEVWFPEATEDRYDLCLHQIIQGLQVIKSEQETIRIGFDLLDAVLITFKNKVNAEKEIMSGFVLQSKWGKMLIIESKNEEVIKLALKNNFVLVARIDPEKRNIRIKTLPKPKYNLTALYKKIISVDKNATWYFHISKNMLLNGSSKNQNHVPSSLTTPQLIEIIKQM